MDKILTKEECYEKATLLELGNNPTGTRQEVVWKAMEIYAQQFGKEILENQFEAVTDYTFRQSVVSTSDIEEIFKRHGIDLEEEPKF